jgi:hypothetical protein
MGGQRSASEKGQQAQLARQQEQDALHQHGAEFGLLLQDCQ